MSAPNKDAFAKAADRGDTTVAVYGGSFNPPHLGHMLAALYVLETCEVDALWFLPTYKHVFGKALASFDDRVAMCRLMAEQLGPRAAVSELEGELGGETSRMVDTLAALAARHPRTRFRLIVGTDILGETDKWHRWDQVVALGSPIVIGRAGVGEPTFAAGNEVGVDPRVLRWDEVQMPAISSTEVRRRLAAGEGAAALVSRGVLEFIASKGLYK